MNPEIDYQNIEAKRAAQKQVDDLLAQLISADTTEEPTMGYQQIQLMKSRNKGFPLDMYHEHLEPKQALNGRQRDLLIANGYSSTYKHRHWPATAYRRNMVTNPDGEPSYPDFVECRTVRDQDEFDRLSKARPARNTQYLGNWVLSYAELAPLPEADTEDPLLKIAALEGQLEEARRQVDKKTKAA